MSFYSEIFASIGLGEMTSALDYNVINYGGRAIYVDGITGILKIDNDQITLDTKKAILEIDGELEISQLEEKSIIIKGRIISVTARLKDGGKKPKKQKE